MFSPGENSSQASFQLSQGTLVKQPLGREGMVKGQLLLVPLLAHRVLGLTRQAKALWFERAEPLPRLSFSSRSHRVPARERSGSQSLVLLYLFCSESLWVGPLQGQT